MFDFVWKANVRGKNENVFRTLCVEIPLIKKSNHFPSFTGFKFNSLLKVYFR